jgi:predicted MPP superfamily phosphohydrolase
VIRVLIIIAFLFFVEFYFYKKLSKSIQNLSPGISKKKLKIFFRLFALYLNLYPLLAISYWIYIIITNERNIIPPQNAFFDYLVIYPFWIGILIIIQSVLILLPVDLIRLVLYPFLKKLKERLKKPQAVFNLIVIIGFMIYVPFRIIYDYNTILVRETIYRKADLPAELDGFKIGFISDMQADWYTDEDRLDEFIAKVNLNNPDLILMAGDVITTTPFYINTAAEYLGKLRSEYGVYSCVGDHDNWAYRSDNERSLKEITEALKKQNVYMIDNDKLLFDVNGDTIGVTFITNTYVERISDKVLDSLVNGKMDYDLKIFLTHQPRQYLIDEAIEYNYDLFLAGHTHGGQITLLFPFYNLSPTLIETGYVRGDFWFDDMMMIVTPGLGMSLAPIRYNSTPEVTIITLSTK